MLHLFTDSGLVLIMLCSECSFMRHKNKIVVLKTQKICVFPLEWNGGIFFPVHSSVGLRLEFQSSKGHSSEIGGKGLCGRAGRDSWAQGIIYPQNSESIHWRPGRIMRSSHQESHWLVRFVPVTFWGPSSFIPLPRKLISPPKYRLYSQRAGQNS